jgi:hypothetical protein
VSDDPASMLGEVISDSVGNSIEKVLDSEQAKNLLSPAAAELGAAFAALASVFRFQTEETLKMIFKKWAKQRGPDRPPLTSEEVLRVMPLLRLAATENDEDLQTRWAALLETSVIHPSDVLPSFGHTLSQLSSDSAGYLERVWQFAESPAVQSVRRFAWNVPLALQKMIELYDPGIHTGWNEAEHIRVHMRGDAEALEAFDKNADKMRHAELIVDDIERLGLIAQQYKTVPDRALKLPDGTLIPAGKTFPGLQSKYVLTRYGVAFIKAVTPKK